MSVEAAGPAGPGHQLGRAVRTRADVAALPDEERRVLAGWLADGVTRRVPRRSALRRRRVTLIALTVGVVVLSSWLGVLSVELPDRHAAHLWRLAWTGFDAALLLAFAAAAWAGWRRRQVALVALVVAGTLLLCDAWFDVTLSWHTDEQLSSILLAVLVEIPLGIYLCFVAFRMLQTLAHLVWRLEGRHEPAPPLRRLPMLTMRAESRD